MEAVTNFIISGFIITVDCGYNHEIKRRLLLGRKAMTYLDSILKNRDITLLTKVHIVKTMVNLRYADDITLMAESEEELKSLLRKSERAE